MPRTARALPKLDAYLEEHQDAFREDLFELLRIPSVSAENQHRADVRRAAEWVAEQFRRLKFTTELVETDGHAIVYAESPEVPGAPTALVYGHYDVQPPDPLDEWITPPFEPTLRDGKVYARGATDDKGQMLTHIKSAQAWIRSQGRLPMQLKYIIEGEEEVGSDHLEPFIRENRDRLACDCAVVSDTAQFAPGQPAITYGLRGIAYYELRLTGPRQDLHSGVFGGAVSNPANALCTMLAALIDDKGRIQIPGFYDDIVQLSLRERSLIEALPFDERGFRERVGADALHGEEGFSTLERRWARPTFDINGLTSGYQGEGSKTVLPARASAKFSFRLVPHQDPEKISVALESRLREICPPGIRMELVDMHRASAVLTSLESPYVAAASRAIERGFGRAPVTIREGGSIPILSCFHDLLGVDTLLLGWGLDDDNMHSPNEKFSLADFYHGIKASAYLWQELAHAGPREEHAA